MTGGNPHAFTTRQRAVLIAAALAFALPGAGLPLTAQTAQARPLLTHHVRQEVINGKARLVGRPPANQTMRLVMVLPLRNQAVLGQFLKDVYDPSKPAYRHYLTVEQFAEQYGPTQDDYDTVTKFAAENGLTVVNTSRNRLNLAVEGNVGAIEHAFNVTMGIYQHPTEDRTFFSPDREPTTDLPFALWHVAGLENYSIPKPSMHRYADDPPPVYTGSAPGGLFLGSDMRAAYYGGTLTGSGQTLGLFELQGTNLDDLNQYFTFAGQTNHVPITLLSTDGTPTDCPASDGCDDTEPTGDMIESLGLAPGLSSLVMYIGSNDASIFNAMATADPLNAQLSCSWFWSPVDPLTDDPYFEEFAAQGQNLFVAAGDHGPWSSLQLVFPQEDVYVTAVGGTTLVTSSAAGPWQSETPWQGGGGGIAPDHFPIPSWQVAAAAGCSQCSQVYRDGPDVSADADLNIAVCANGACHVIAGTSFAAPIWAGYLALVNEQSVANGNSTVGFINPALYAIGASSSYNDDFHDITTGITGYGATPNQATVGYDLATGWGSPNGAGLLNALANYGVAPVFSGLTASPGAVSVSPGASATVLVDSVVSAEFNASIALSASGQPAGVSIGFSPPSISGKGSSTMTVTAAASTAPGNYTITVTGVSGTTSQTAAVSLVVANTLSPQNFGNANVCPLGQGAPTPCSNMQTLNFPILSSTTIGAVKVVTQGIPNLDFTLAGTTCTGSLTAPTACTVQVQFAPLAPGLRMGAVQLMDSSQHLVSTEFVYGVGDGPAIAFGSVAQATVGSGFNSPAGVAVDAAGNVFIADFGETNLTGGVVEIPVGGGPPIAIGSGLSHPVGIALDGAGDIFISNFSSGNVVEVPAGGGPQVTIASGLVHPTGLTVDAAGDVFITDAGTGVAEVAASGGPKVAVGKGFQYPAGVAVDAAGDVFIADTGNDRVVEVRASDGAQTTLYTGLYEVTGVALDAAGEIYISQLENPGTSQVLELPAAGVPPIPIASGLNTPYGLTVDGAGNVFFTDFGSAQVFELPRSQPPTLSFASTEVAYTSTDSPQLVAIQNAGNEPLAAVPPGLSAGPNFTLGTGLGVPSTCTGSFLLAPGASCNMSISFAPALAGTFVTSAVVTDDTFNAANAMQSITLQGTGTAPVLSFSLNGGPNTSVTANGGLQMTFPLTPVGQSVTEDFAITINTGGNSVVFNTIALAPGFGDFTLGTITGCVVDGSTPNPSGTVCTIPVTFAPKLPGNASASAPLARSAPLLVSDVENGTLEQYAFGLVGSGTKPLPVLVPGIITDIVGNDMTVGSNAFSVATNLAVDAAGNIYISDTGNCVVLRVDKLSQTTTTVAGIQQDCAGGTQGTPHAVAATATTLGNHFGIPLNTGAPGTTGTPLGNNFGIALDTAGNLYIADSANSAVRMLNAATGTITTVAGTLSVAGYGGDGGPATQALLNNPQGIAVDGAGDLFIVDTGNYIVREVQAGTGVIRTIAGVPGVQGYPGGEVTGPVSSTPATSFLFEQPEQVAVDSLGDVYITDVFSGNNLWRVDAVAQTIANIPTSGVPPGGIALDASDTLYYTAGCIVYKQPQPASVNPPGAIIVAGSLAGGCGNNGTGTGPGDGGPATLGGLNAPVAVVVDGTGSLYILETDGVRFVDSTGALPVPVSFGASPLLTPSATQSVQLFNGDIATPAGASTNPLQVYFSGLSSPFATTPALSGQDCSLATATASIPLDPAGFCTLSMVFTPQVSGGVAASTSLFETPSSTTLTQTLNLTGTGGSGLVTLTPSPLSFTTVVGDTSPPANLTLSNNTANAIDITGMSIIAVSYGGFQFTSNCPAVLEPNSSCTIPVAFTPYIVGTDMGDTFEVNYIFDPGQGSYTGVASAGLVGVGGTASGTFGAGASGVSFGTQLIYTTSAPTVLTLTSTGTLPLAISTVTLGGTNPTQFTISATTCTNATLAPQATCTVSVEFTPLTDSYVDPLVGGITPFTATVTVVDNDPNETPAPVPLSGTGVGPIPLKINETLHLSDAPVPVVALQLPIFETLSLSDVPLPVVALQLPVFETLHLSDAPVPTPLQTATTTSLAISSSPILLGARETLIVQISSNSATGTVNLYDDGTLVSTLSLSNGTGLYSTTGLSAGIHLLNAVYSGNGTFLASTSSNVEVIVQTPLTITAQNFSRKFGVANSAFTYTVSGLINTDTAAILTGTPFFTTRATLNSPAGQYPISISQGTLVAPAYYSLNFVGGTLTVSSNSSQTITFPPVPTLSIAVLQHITLTAHSTSGLPITYTVTTGPATVSGSTLTLTGTGTLTVTASQAGSTTFSPAKNVSQSFTVTP